MMIDKKIELEKDDIYIYIWKKWNESIDNERR